MPNDPAFLSPALPLRPLLVSQVSSRQPRARQVRAVTTSHASATMPPTPPEGVTRRRVPLVSKDLVTVQDPELITKIASSPDIGRPGEAELPWLLKLYFKATKFIYPPTNRWFIALEGDDKNNRLERREAVEGRIAKGFTDAQICRLTDAVKGEGDLVQVGAEVAKVMAEVVLPLADGQTLPQDVAEATVNTALEVSVLFNPPQYLAARAARNKVEEYVRSVLPEGAEVGDFTHNLGAAAQGMGKALISMRDMKTSDLHAHFGNNPMVAATTRIPKKTTTIGGMFPGEAPLTPNSLVVLDITTAAMKTLDEKFLFSSGTETRQCPFKGLFFDTTAEIQKKISS